jgi:4-diphosphocytidyl-2-C-methyl-D-erythritol kinase
MNKYLSPAKINWFLHITGRRADGYHLLQTVFQRIDWHDELLITPRHDGVITLQGDLSGVPEYKNLAYRAASALRESVGRDALGATIVLSKNIPTGAGLGGGSSNAATVLNALNDLWQLNLPNIELQKIGLQLGADVPFFVSGLNAAFASGIGETLTPIDLPTRPLLLVNPNVHVATAAVFNHPDLIRNHAHLSLTMDELSHLLKQPNADPPLTNDLEKATFALSTDVQAVYHTLNTLAPDACVRMSGSGATVFAAPTNEAEWHVLEQWRLQCAKHWQVRWVNTPSN